MIAVIICSANRPLELDRTVASLRRQTVPPGRIIVPVPGEKHVLDETRPMVEVVQSERGLCRQRNTGIAQLSGGEELVVFLDDDVELHPDYLRAMAAIFKESPELVLCSGNVLADGGIDRAGAEALLRAAPEPEHAVRPCASAYGCNMAVRPWVLEQVGFDERLPLYGWLEDADFSAACARLGLVAHASAPRLVHLGVRSGRVPGRTFGYAQIMNPLYLWRKGSLPSLGRVVGHFWLRALLRNAEGALREHPVIDYRGRLRGNVRAFRTLLRGRIAPEDC